MKIIYFKYTKASGEMSERVLTVLHEPSDKWSGFDITALSDADTQALVSKLNKCHDRYLTELQAALDTAPIKISFKNFKESGIDTDSMETAWM